MKKNILLFILLLSLFNSCKKKEIVMDDIINLVVSDTTDLKANGKSKIKLEALIPANAGESYRKITFTTTNGIIDGTILTSKEVRADNFGKATVYVTISSIPGVFYVSASTGSGSSIYKVEYPVTARPISTNSKLALVISDTTNIRADNFAIFKISASVSNSTERTVKFTLNEGFILGAGNIKDRIVPTDDYGKAEIFVKTDVNALPYMLSAELNSTTIVNGIIPVRRAYADSMVIEPSGLKIDTVGGSINIKAILTRNNGKVSLQTPVYFDSYQINNLVNEIQVGRFTGLSNTSNLNGEVTVNFFADTGNLNRNKPIYIRVKTKRDNGQYITKILSLLIK